MATIYLRASALTALFISTAFASEPAKVHTKVTDGGTLSFWVENKYHSPITRFQVTATSSSGNLGCSLTAEVKQPKASAGRDSAPLIKRGASADVGADRESVALRSSSNDLHPPGTCRFSTDGRKEAAKYKARIVYVEFADGMRWTTNE